MSNNKSNLFGGKGYYIALILCAAAIGITGYLYRKNANSADVSLQSADTVMGTGVTIPVLGTEAPTQTEQTETTAPVQAPTVPRLPAKKTLRTAAPAPGSEIFGYSMDCLSYNQTTRDWRTHNGVDIAAEPGSDVCAAAEGTVVAVFEDDAMGYTVAVRHEGGYTTHYSSLTEDVCVQEGDRVSLGQKLGSAGDSALLESALGSHIHFSVTLDDEAINPADFLALG